MTHRNYDKPLILVVTPGASGNSPESSVDDEALFDQLGDEFDFVILEPGHDGDPILRPRFRADGQWIAAEVLRLEYDAPGGINAAIRESLGDDELSAVYVLPGSSALRGLADLAAGTGITIVNVKGRIDAQATMRRWTDHVDDVTLWMFDSESTVDFADPQGSLDPEHIAIVPTPIDYGRRGSVEDAIPDAHEPLRFAMRVGRFAQRSLVNAERVAKRLPPGIEVHVFGAPPGASRRGMRAHRAVDPALFPDVLRMAGIHILQVNESRDSFDAANAAILSGTALFCPPTGAEAERVRRDAIGWIVDSEDLDATAQLLIELNNNRFELERAMSATKRATVSSGAADAAVVASHIRRLVTGI